MTKQSKIKIIIGIIIQTIAYVVVLLLVTKVFKKSITIELHPEITYLWYILTSVAIVILNRTLKPIIKYLTLPLSALTFGFAYPLVNVAILYVADVLLGKKFSIHSIKMIFIIAITISLLTYMTNLIIIKIARKIKVWK